jgi:tRNA (cytidine/uridine-2'-O-)-methyltransferase
MSSCFNVVLVRPRIPPNAGNVARLCAATRSRLHLVRPLGFRLDDRQMKRAGLDYWEHLDLTVHESWDEFLAENSAQPIYFFSKKGRRLYSEVKFTPGDFLVFGSETGGLPEAILRENEERTVRLPILEPKVRSLNLADSVAAALYEALRQNAFLSEG